MKGPWKVTANPIGDQVMYAVYRLLDTTAIDHSGNREFAPVPYMPVKAVAEKIAAQMNAAEKATERALQRPYIVSVFLDRDQYCALIGADLQEGTAGFGDTVYAALRDLADRIAEKVIAAE